MTRSDYRLRWWEAILALLLMTIVFNGLYALLQLIVYGHVRWH
jgi:hypothetical protein